MSWRDGDNVQRRSRIEPGIFPTAEGNGGSGAILDVDAIAHRERRVDRRFGPALIRLILRAGLTGNSYVAIESIQTRSERNGIIRLDLARSALESRPQYNDQNSAYDRGDSEHEYCPRNWAGYVKPSACSIGRHNRTPLADTFVFSPNIRSGSYEAM